MQFIEWVRHTTQRLVHFDFSPVALFLVPFDAAFHALPSYRNLAASQDTKLTHRAGRKAGLPHHNFRCLVWPAQCLLHSNSKPRDEGRV